MQVIFLFFLLLGTCPPTFADTPLYAHTVAPDIQRIDALNGYTEIPVNVPEVPAVPTPYNSERSLEETVAGESVDSYWSQYFPQLENLVTPENLSDPSFSKLTLLVDGEEVVRSVVPDIQNARDFIHIEIYEWHGDTIGQGLRDLLAEKVQAGVRVRVILDQFGSGLMKPRTSARRFLQSMRDAGIDAKMRKFKLLHLDHRKVMVMDDGQGSILAYTGGMNIGEDYQQNWHDQQTRVTCPAAAQLHSSFIDSWEDVAGERLSGFPIPQDLPDGALVRVIKHVGGNADQDIKQAYLLAIATARKLIRIEDPYFSDKDIIQALIDAASDPHRPGLKVQLIVPAKTNVPVTLRGFRSHYKDMLKAGIEVYEYQPRMEHLKVAVIDHFWATVGSSNLDDMSLKYNNEMNLLVLDRQFARELDERIFDVDIPQSLRITEYNFNIIDAIAGTLPFRTDSGAASEVDPRLQETRN